MDINNTRQIATVEDFEKLRYAYIPLREYDDNGNLIELIVKVKRTGLTNMLKSGQLPDSLLSVAVSLTKPGGSQDDAVDKVIKDGGLDKMYGIMEQIARGMLVEPKYDDIKDMLSMDMLNQIMSYCTGGMTELQRFHTEQENLRRNSGSESI